MTVPGSPSASGGDSGAGAGAGAVPQPTTPSAPTTRRLIPVGAQPSRQGGAAQPVVNVFDAVGGQPFFDELVERFYRGVADDPVLRPCTPTT